MKKFIFVTGIMRGNYVSVTDVGEEVNYSGVSLYLGTSKGENVTEAWEKLLGKHGLDICLPDFRTHDIIAFEIADDGVELSAKIKGAMKPTNVVEPGSVKVGKFGEKTCQWCGEVLPGNGAAQFSHLKKHINWLVSKEVLTKEESQAIRSVKLTPEMEKKFKIGFKK